MKKTRYEVESDVNNIVEELIYAHDLESDFYGDCYPDEAVDLENWLEMCKDPELYEELLAEVKEVFESYI